jgi:hypothetical protein
MSATHPGYVQRDGFSQLNLLINDNGTDYQRNGYGKLNDDQYFPWNSGKPRHGITFNTRTNEKMINREWLTSATRPVKKGRPLASRSSVFQGMIISYRQLIEQVTKGLPETTSKESQRDN